MEVFCDTFYNCSKTVTLILYIVGNTYIVFGDDVKYEFAYKYGAIATDKYRELKQNYLDYGWTEVITEKYH